MPCTLSGVALQNMAQIGAVSGGNPHTLKVLPCKPNSVYTVRSSLKPVYRLPILGSMASPCNFERGLSMAKVGRFGRFLAFVAIGIVAWLAVNYFGVPALVVVWIMLLAVYLDHESRLHNISLDLHAIEQFLAERYPEEFSIEGAPFRGKV